MSHQQSMPRLAPQTQKRIRELSKAGWGHRKIAKALNLAATTVARVRYHLGLLAPSWASCGHPRTEENTVTSGSGSEQCRTCKIEWNRRYRQRGQAAPEEAPIDDCSPIALYRTEKAKREERLSNRADLAEAYQEYLRALERTAPHRQGRPRKSPGGGKARNDIGRNRPGKPQLALQRHDPADVLLQTLPPYYGRSA